MCIKTPKLKNVILKYNLHNAYKYIIYGTE